MSKESNTVKEFNLNRSTSKYETSYSYSLNYVMRMSNCAALIKILKYQEKRKEFYKTLLNFMRHKLT